MKLVLVLLAGAAVAAPASAAVSPPVIHEQFTLLPCPAHPQTTLALEGCSEHTIVRVDRQIDAVVKQLFGLLPDASARADLAAAQRAWLAYRRADCTSLSDQDEHGTLAGVVAADCTANRSQRRLRDLQGFVKALRGS
jgi:uncharacterized protein YecT (DUF1311 family)